VNLSSGSRCQWTVDQAQDGEQGTHCSCSFLELDCKKPWITEVYSVIPTEIVSLRLVYRQRWQHNLDTPYSFASQRPSKFLARC
jgi:hypothetical protein